jgi:hypothetical protein
MLNIKTARNVETRKIFEKPKKVPHITTKELISRSEELFNSEYATEEQNSVNREKWVKSIMILGDRWLFAKPIPKPEIPFE